MELTKQFLIQEYLGNKKSGYKIAKELGIKKHVVDNAITKFGIKRRSILQARLPKGSGGKSGFKWCSKCSKDKELKQFSKGNNRFGLDAWCKSCNSKRAKKYFEKRNMDRVSIKSKLIIEFGNKCKKCGAEDLPIACYVFHHHSEKMCNKNYISPNKVITSKNNDLIESEKKKWDLLCSNCHNLIHSQYKLPATKSGL